VLYFSENSYTFGQVKRRHPFFHKERTLERLSIPEQLILAVVVLISLPSVAAGHQPSPVCMLCACRRRDKNGFSPFFLLAASESIVHAKLLFLVRNSGGWQVFVLFGDALASWGFWYKPHMKVVDLFSVDTPWLIFWAFSWKL
jgi:hypothetical protein